MDIVYLSEKMIEQGVLQNVEYDGEQGKEYDFTLRCKKSDYSKVAGRCIYPQGAFDFGGKVLKCVSKSNEDTVEFYGKTWLGLLGMHETPTFAYVSGNHYGHLADYLNDILSIGHLLTVIVPDEEARTLDVGTSIVPPEDDPDVYNPLELLKSLYSELNMVPRIRPVYTNGILSMQIGARSANVYSQDDYSSDVLPLEVEKVFQPVTEIWTMYRTKSGSKQLGQNAYLDETGKWWINTPSHPYTYTGLNANRKVVVIDADEASDPNWDEIIASVQEVGYAHVDIIGALQPDVGDWVSGIDRTTGIEAAARVTTKTLHIADEIATMTFEADKGD